MESVRSVEENNEVEHAQIKNKFKRLLMSAATIGTACLLAGCGAGAAAGTDNSGVTESQSGGNGSEQENASTR